MGTQEQRSEEERRALRAFVKLMRATESVTGRLSGQLAKEGLTPSQFGALEALLHKGPMCQKALGAKILKTTGNITMVVDNLEKRGLVRRERGAEDRRYVTVHLTATGRALIERVFPQHAAAITERMAALSPEQQDELGRLCRQLGRANAA